MNFQGEIETEQINKILKGKHSQSLYVLPNYYDK